MPFRQRKRQNSDSDESDTPNSDAPSVSATIESNKNIIKMRKRAKGINASSLALGVKVSRVEEYTMEKDPFKYKPSSKLRHVKDRDRDRKYDLVDRDVTDLGNTFSQQTNSQDTDAQMKRYIENQMRKAKGEVDPDADKNKKILSAEDKLYQLPKRLQMHESQSAKRSEEMLSNQMLSGIPEVDLGIDTKIKNIERTEEAKIELIKEMKKKKEKPSQFVPSNMAVNYVQHKRYLPSGSAHQTSNPKAKQLQVKKQSELVVGDNSAEENKEKFNEKSSDDYHYDKFRNNARKK